MGAYAHAWERGGGTCPPPTWRGALAAPPTDGWEIERHSRLGLPFGPSLGVQMLHTFQFQGALPPDPLTRSDALGPAAGSAPDPRYQL